MRKTKKLLRKLLADYRSRQVDCATVLLEGLHEQRKHS